MYSAKIVGENLRFCRILSGRTIREISEMTGIAKSGISCYECGVTCPTLEFAAKLCEFYGVSLDWLLTPHKIRAVDANA